MQICFPLKTSFTNVDANGKELLDNVSQHLKDFANKFDYKFPEYKDPPNGNLWMTDLSLKM